MNEWSVLGAIWVGVQKHLCVHTNARLCIFLLSLTHQLTYSPAGKKKCLYCIDHDIYDLIWCEALLIPTEAFHRPRVEEDLVSNTYTYTKDECMHSNTTSFVVNALAAPHTIKVPIKGHYGFSTRGNHRESSSMACTLRAHRCLLCCHPKELRLIRKLYDHNY